MTTKHNYTHYENVTMKSISYILNKNIIVKLIFKKATHTALNFREESANNYFFKNMQRQVIIQCK